MGSTLLGLKRIFHWGPLSALGIIKCITFMMLYCCSMWWPPGRSFAGLLYLCVFMTFSSLTLYNFLNAIIAGPGYLPQGWVPADPEDTVFLQYCTSCLGFKAPRAHHCRKCGRCVLKMDHHCPWINNCVGHANHAHFIAFLFFATCGCFQGSITFACCLYRAVHRMWYLYYGSANEPIIYMPLPALIICVFSLGLAIGVVIAVGMIFIFQMRGVYHNRTAIEDWIVQKAHFRQREGEPDFIYPYDKGWKNNLRQVLSWSCDPVGDGINWPLVDGCDEYALTREQLLQKNEKRLRTRPYVTVHDYSGSWCPLSYGWCVVFHPPLTDESRIRLKTGDIVYVTRWKRYWLFGEKEQQSQTESPARARGWFPSFATVPVTEGPIHFPTSLDVKKVT